MSLLFLDEAASTLLGDLGRALICPVKVELFKRHGGRQAPTVQSKPLVRMGLGPSAVSEIKAGCGGSKPPPYKSNLTVRIGSRAREAGY